VRAQADVVDVGVAATVHDDVVPGVVGEAGQNGVGHALSRRAPSHRSSNRKETEMRKVVVNEFMSLDAVVQAPGGTDEDTSGGFKHGGWHLRYFDDISQRSVVENLAAAGGFLLGAAPTRSLRPTGRTRPRRSRSSPGL
jgi:hypothetical protein